MTTIIRKNITDEMKRFVSLRVLDTLWKDHLSNMEHMRDSVKLRAYGGKDPLVEYKNEGHRLFSQLLQEMDDAIADNILKAGQQPHAHQHAPPRIVQQMAQGQKAGEEIGRNDECPCGSGKKWKKCGMINSLEHQQNMNKK